MREASDLDVIDHIGWALWRATQSWKRRFIRDMARHGFGWFGEARGGLVQFIGRGGLPQTELAAKAGMTKQAVQQHLDDLVADGIVERVADAADSRRKLVRFTAKGIKALAAANEVKLRIEADYARSIGQPGMRTLKRALARIAADDA